MIEAISGKRPRFRTSIEDFSRQARSKLNEMGWAEGRYPLASGDDMQVQKRLDGTVDLDVTRPGGSSARLDLNPREKDDARISQLEEGESEKQRGDGGAEKKPPDPLGRGQFVDVVV